MKIRGREKEEEEVPVQQMQAIKGNVKRCGKTKLIRKERRKRISIAGGKEEKENDNR